MADKTKDKEEEAPKNSALALAGAGSGSALEAYEAYHGEDAGAGLEQQTSADVGVPFMVLLQPGSPSVLDEDSPARPGMWSNTTTGELFAGKDGITFIPAYTEHKAVEWVPRDAGGGLADTHDMDSEIVRRCREKQPIGSWKHPDMWRPDLGVDDLKKINDIVETFYVYGVFVHPETGEPSPAVISFSSTHIKPYRDWQFKIRSVVIPLGDGRKLTARDLPLWALAWQLRSEKREKASNTWYVPSTGFAAATAVQSLVAPGTVLYDAAKSIYEGVKTGEKKADTSGLSRAGAAPDAEPVKGDTAAKDAPY